MLDPFADDFRSLSKLLEELPIRPSPSVICRWHLRGVAGRRLKVLKIAGRLYSTRTELRNFLQEIQRPSDRPTNQERRLDAELEAAGLLGSPICEAEAAKARDLRRRSQKTIHGGCGRRAAKCEPFPKPN